MEIIQVLGRVIGLRRAWWALSASLFVFSIFIWGATACVGPASASIPLLQKNIVGKWANAQGGEIDFYADGTGSIPGVQDIPSYNFTYSFPDNTHLLVIVDGQNLKVGIRIDGDKMIWRNSDNNTEFVYTRAK